MRQKLYILSRGKLIYECNVCIEGLDKSGEKKYGIFPRKRRQRRY